MTVSILDPGPSGLPIVSMALLGGGGAPGLMEPLHNFVEVSFSVSPGKVRDVSVWTIDGASPLSVSGSFVCVHKPGKVPSPNHGFL